jgi:hypothetical protein
MPSSSVKSRTEQQRIVTQKIVLFIVTAVIAADPTFASLPHILFSHRHSTYF